MKILVLGGSGFLGRNILKKCKIHNVTANGTHYTHKINDTIKLDLTNQQSTLEIIKQFSPDTIIHCAFLRNKICEENPSLSQRINIQGTKNVAEICKENNIHLIFISSDSVFDGTIKTNEKSKPYPSSIFGQHKLQCEEIVSNLPHFCIARTSMLFGWDPRHTNFVQWVISELSNNHQIKVISDQFVTPSYCKNIAEIILEASSKKLHGLYNIAGKEIITRANFAYKIAKIFHLSEKLIIPTPLQELNLDMKRGKNCALDISKSLSTFSTRFMSLEQALQEMFEEKLA